MNTDAHKQRTRPWTWLLITGFLFLNVGCNPFAHDPEQTVHIEISSITEQAERDEVHEILKGMTEGSGHVITTKRDRDTLLIKLSPVRDVQAFARRINFGQVTEIEGRTVRIEYIKPGSPSPEKEKNKLRI